VYTTPEPEPESPEEESGDAEAEAGEYEDDYEEEPENENKVKDEHEDVHLNHQNDYVFSEDNFTPDHNTRPIPSPRRSPTPIRFEHQSSPLPNLNEDVQEGFNSMFFDPASLILLTLTPTNITP